MIPANGVIARFLGTVGLRHTETGRLYTRDEQERSIRTRGLS